MLDAIVKKVSQVREYIGKEIVHTRMKLIIVQGDKLCIVQKKFFDRRLLFRPGRILFESEQSAAKRLIKLVTDMVRDQEVVIVKSNAANNVDYVFWFAPDDWNVTSREELKGYILFVSELLRLEHEFTRLHEASITTELYAVALSRRKKNI